MDILDIAIDLYLSGFTYTLQGCVYWNFVTYITIQFAKILIHFWTQIQNQSTTRF